MPNRLGKPVPASLSRDARLDNAFARSKEKWRPLYGELLAATRKALPEFYEYFPAVGILWKHTSAFAGVKLTQNAMQIEFYADRLHPERCPVKHLQTSANRVVHLIEVSDASNFNALVEWLKESYVLTVKK